MKQLSFIAAAAAFAPIVEAEYLAAHGVDDDNPRLNALGDLGNLIARCLAEAPAQSLSDLAAKSVVMKIQLPEGKTPGTLWKDACEQERLAWSMAEDAARLADRQWKADPALAAAEACHSAHNAYNAFEGDDASPESKALWQAVETTVAEAYRTTPTTAAGIEALFGVMMRREAGCQPDMETFIALDTLKAAFAEVER